MFDRFYDDIRYLAFVSDSDKLDAQGVKSYGKVTYSNIAIHAELNSCLRDTDFSFDLADCSIRNFLLSAGAKLESRDCANSDPLLEMFAFFDATQETEVYEKIEKICSFAYESDAFDFTKTLSLTDQLVPEYIGEQLLYMIRFRFRALELNGCIIMHLKMEAQSGTTEATARKKLLKSCTCMTTSPPRMS